MKDIHARVPIDRTAATAISKGVEFIPQKAVVNRDTDLPIAARPATTAERNNKSFVDLTGNRFGRFVVVGISDEFAARWVVRCDCGRYTTRTAKAIKNPSNAIDRCEHCRHLAHLRRDEYWRRTGRELDWSNL